jgi:serine phosphatase RsbU (regulator of sigma subunit)/anti-sigma regulatory factor (Ser/Thr protein kinase)
LLASLGVQAARLSLGGKQIAQFAAADELLGSAPPFRFRSGGLLCEVWGSADPGLLRAAAAQFAAVVDQMIETASAHQELIATLVETQDQMVSLYAVAQLQAGSMELDEVDQRLLPLVSQLTRSIAVALVGPDTAIRSWGEPDAVRWLVEAGAGQDWTTNGRWHRLSGEVYTGLLWPLAGRRAEPAALVLARSLELPFRTTDFKLMGFLGGTVASARDAAVLHQEAIRNAKIEQEHEVTSRLAQAVLPSHPPKLPGCEVAEVCIPARSAGGDFYTHAVAGGTLFFAVGDVAGKGLPAALVMTKVIAACTAAFAAHGPQSLEEMVSQLCETLYPYLADIGLFATILVGTYHPASGEVQVLNAGHSPTLVVRADGIDQVPPVMPPLGVLPTRTGAARTIQLGEGDLLVIGSDGLTEQENPDGELFGYDRLEHELAQLHGQPADSVHRQVMRLVEMHGAGVPASDDQTLMVIRHGDSQELAPDRSGSSIILEANHLALRELGPWLAGVCQDRLGDPGRLGKLELGLHELCTNIVDHSYRGGPGRIRITAWLQPGAVRFESRDVGVAFVPGPAGRPEPGIAQIRGYGLMLIEQLVDSVSYERVGDENVWTVISRWEP